MNEPVNGGARVIVARPLTAEAFARYGQVLQGTGPETERKEFASRMQNGRPHARPNMTYMKVRPAAAPVLVRAVERHPFSNQTFVPLNGTQHLVAVCPSAPDGSPLVGQLEVFLASGSQAVNYDANVWHAPRTALGMPGEFVMFRWDDGGPLDTELVPLAAPVVVELPGH
jgi:ureidoglycolate lyase